MKCLEYPFLSHANAAQRNRNNILHHIRRHQPLSRTDIWEAMEISRASVTQVIRQLEESGLITAAGYNESTGGRKQQCLVFNGAGTQFFSFDWLSKRLALMDLNGSVLQEVCIEIPQPVQPMAFATILTKAVQNLQKKHSFAEDACIGLVLSLPGLLNPHSGTVIYSVELGWQDVQITEPLKQLTGMDIYAERLTHVMALGCRAADCPEVSHYNLFLLDAAGIGVTSVVGGRCHYGANFMQGELGHIKTGENILCACGQKGCLEAVIKDRLQSSNGVLTEEVLELLSVGIAASINLSDVSCAVMTGTYVEQMTEAQQTYLKEAICDKVTGRHMRRLDLDFSVETREMTQKGMCAYMFDRHFPIV